MRTMRRASLGAAGKPREQEQIVGAPHKRGPLDPGGVRDRLAVRRLC